MNSDTGGLVFWFVAGSWMIGSPAQRWHWFRIRLTSINLYPVNQLSRLGRTLVQTGCLTPSRVYCSQSTQYTKKYRFERIESGGSTSVSIK